MNQEKAVLQKQSQRQNSHSFLCWQMRRLSFLTGQDRTSKFAGQVIPDRTESGLIFLNILTTEYGISILIRHTIRSLNTNFLLKLFFLFFYFQKPGGLGSKTSGFWTVWILKIWQTSGPDVMSSRTLPGGGSEIVAQKLLGELPVKWNWSKTQPQLKKCWHTNK